jgi:hypothetical protein
VRVTLLLIHQFWHADALSNLTFRAVAAFRVFVNLHFHIAHRLIGSCSFIDSAHLAMLFRFARTSVEPAKHYVFASHRFMDTETRLPFQDLHGREPYGFAGLSARESAFIQLMGIKRVTIVATWSPE